MSSMWSPKWRKKWKMWEVSAPFIIAVKEEYIAHILGNCYGFLNGYQISNVSSRFLCFSKYGAKCGQISVIHFFDHGPLMITIYSIAAQSQLKRNKPKCVNAKMPSFFWLRTWKLLFLIFMSAAPQFFGRGSVISQPLLVMEWCWSSTWVTANPMETRCRSVATEW